MYVRRQTCQHPEDCEASLRRAASLSLSPFCLLSLVLSLCLSPCVVCDVVLCCVVVVVCVCGVVLEKRGRKGETDRLTADSRE